MIWRIFIEYLWQFSLQIYLLGVCCFVFLSSSTIADAQFFNLLIYPINILLVRICDETFLFLFFIVISKFWHLFICVYQVSRSYLFHRNILHSYGIYLYVPFSFSDALPKSRRRKSETFRAQYINTKEIKYVSLCIFKIKRAYFWSLNRPSFHC